MMDQLVLREFLPLFGIGVLTFSVLISSFTLLKDAIEYYGKGIPWEIVLQGFLLGLAQVVAYTLPMGVLLGALMAFGRLSNSGEITALRAGGINFLRIATPVLMAAYVIACLAFLFNERIAPQLNLRAQNLIKQAAIQVGAALTNKQIVQYIKDKDTGQVWILAAASSSGNTLNELFLTDIDPKGRYTIYRARQGEWGAEGWILRDVDYQQWEPDAPNPVPPIVTSAKQVKIDLKRTPAEILRFARNPEELSLKELQGYIQEQLDDLQRTREELARLEADPSTDATILESTRKDVLSQQRGILKMETKYHLKIAAPFACVIFALLAAPLGMNPLRATSSIGFGLSMILVFVYYLLTTLAVNYSASGNVSPEVLAWVPNAVFTVYGLYLNGQFIWSSGK